MYTHRRVDYAAFRVLTQYPKMDRTVGWVRTMMMANPYEIFGFDLLASRGLHQEDVRQRFAHWARFMIVDLRHFFLEHGPGTTTWPNVRNAMLSDHDCTWDPYGAILQQYLDQDRGVTGRGDR